MTDNDQSVDEGDEEEQSVDAETDANTMDDEQSMYESDDGDYGWLTEDEENDQDSGAARRRRPSKHAIMDREDEYEKDDSNIVQKAVGTGTRPRSGLTRLNRFSPLPPELRERLVKRQNKWKNTDHLPRGVMSLHPGYWGLRNDHPTNPAVSSSTLPVSAY